MSNIQIRINGLNELKKKFGVASQMWNQTLSDASTLVGDAVLNTRGVKQYPPMTDANRPPAPYYIRGKGTQTSKGNLLNSQRLGTNLFSEGKVTSFGAVVTIGTRNVTYAPYVIGEQQSRAMARIGWRKLKDVAIEKQDKIRRTFEAVIQAALKRAGL